MLRSVLLTAVLLSPEVALADPPATTVGATKVVCFGDSITKAGYPAMLAAKLGVEVVNAGLGGHTTAAALPKMRKEVLDYRPDAVVLFFGTNDSRLAEPPVHVPPAKYEANLIEMIDRCRAIHAKPVICTIPPINPEPYFKRHARANFDAAGGMPKVLAEYRAAALHAAQARKVPVVDLNQLLEKRPEWLAPDGVHPTKQGNAILADLIAEAVAPLVGTAAKKE